MKKFYKVRTSTGKIYKVKAVEESKGLFGGKKIWRLYSSNYNAIFHSYYTHIGDCEDINRIGEAIRIAILNTTSIEIINH